MKSHWHEKDFEVLTADDVRAYCAVCPEYVGELDDFRYTPLIGACMKGKAEIARALLEAGADPNFVASDGETPLKAAVPRRSEKFDRVLFDLLLNAGAELNTGLMPVLHEAVGKGNRELVKYLIEHGADPNMRDADDCTALFWTGVFGGRFPDVKMIQLLLKLGADLSQVDGVGQTLEDRIGPKVMLEAMRSYEED